MIVRLVPLWALIVALVVLQARALTLDFDTRLPLRNLTALRHRQHPKLAKPYDEQLLDDALADWKLDRPLRVALPPMYSQSTFGNASFLAAFANHGEVILYNEPYPRPKLSIDEHIGGDNPSPGYHFDNRSTNAALYTTVGSVPWPVGYTTWYDALFEHVVIDIDTPRLVSPDGFVIEPTAVRAVHPLNHVNIFGDTTQMEMSHLSPVVWTFPREGRLQKSKPGYVVESVADGAEVSYLPSLPRYRHPFGLLLLSGGAAPTVAPAPHWWPIDERFRRSVVDGRPYEERRSLLQELAREYPTHPFLDHYRVIAELGSDRFDDAWLGLQRRVCALPSWYLVAWTHLPWSRVRELPCINGLQPQTNNAETEYIAESVVLAFRADRDDPELQALAARVVDRSYLKREFRGFNYPLSNFAWLWLKARP